MDEMANSPPPPPLSLEEFQGIPIDELIPEKVMQVFLQNQDILLRQQREEEERRIQVEEEQRIQMEEERRIQIQEDAALADLLQDAEEEEAVQDDFEDEVESGYESDMSSEHGEIVEQQQQQEIVDSDMETVDNNHDGGGDIDGDGDREYVPEYPAQMNEVALRRAINVRRRFHRNLGAVFREARNNEIMLLREQLRLVQQAARRQHHQELADVPRRNFDFCFGCAKRFWCQRNRQWRRCDACGFWLCPDCNENPVHCQNEQDLF